MSGVGYVVKSMTVSIKEGTSAAVDVECAVTGVYFDPTQSVQTSVTACATDPAVTDVGPISWTARVDYNVSLLPASFHRLLNDHAGKRATLTVEPFPLTEPGHKIECDVTLTPGGPQLAVGSFGNASASLPVAGGLRYIDPVTP